MGFGGLYISVSGINANKKALDTVSHNIANVNNENYVRQAVTHKERSYSPKDVRFQKGTGVHINQIRQIRDEFLDTKLRREMASFGYYNTKSEILSQVESIFNEITSSGLQNVMDEFWDGWSELIKEPESLTIRGIVHENAVALTTTINHISTQLDNLQMNLNQEMINKTKEVNALLERVADLNKQIKMAEGYGPHVNANDYRDERNAALDRLSQLIPIQNHENQYGEEMVSMFGRDLVGGDFYNPMEIRFNHKGHGQIYWSHVGEGVDLKGLGELGGYIDARDGLVVEYRQRINILAGVMAKGVNDIHKQGWDLEGKQEELPFFQISNPKDPAATIHVNPALADFTKIAISKSGAKGDGEIAREILDIREKLLFANYDASKYDNYNFSGQDGYPLEDEEIHLTMDDFYRDLALSIGLEGQQARTMVENQGILISQIENRKQEVSSVSLDEEMTDMLRYQHSYIANSRVINAIDEMIENIVNRMGLVGR